MDQVLLGHRRYDIVDHILLRNCSAVPNMSKPHGKGRNIMGHDPKQSTKPIQNSKRPFPSMRRPSQGSWPSCQGCLRDWAPLPSAFPPWGGHGWLGPLGETPCPPHGSPFNHGSGGVLLAGGAMPLRLPPVDWPLWPSELPLPWDHGSFPRSHGSPAGEG